MTHLLMFGSFYQQNKKLTVLNKQNKISNTYATIKDDVYFNGLTIPVSEFIYHANKSIIFPLDAYKVAEWRNSHPPTEQFKEMVNATTEEDNPLLLIFDFKKQYEARFTNAYYFYSLFAVFLPRNR